MSKTLGELGEFAIIENIILPKFQTNGNKHLGDDCAFINLNANSEETLVVTTDAAPRPFLWSLGVQSYKSLGWYAVHVNASDLATAGAKPLCFTSSVEAPADMNIQDLEAFFEGMSQASEVFGFASAGGNIRENPLFECHATAIGTVRKGQEIGRDGARSGDILISIGSLGNFATSGLKARRLGINALSQTEFDVLAYPMAHVPEMMRLRELGFLHAASDNSDGVIGAIFNITSASKCGAILDFNSIKLSHELMEEAKFNGYNPWNLALCWGDWQVIVSISPEMLTSFKELCMEENFEFVVLGSLTNEHNVMTAKYQEDEYILPLLRNENFSNFRYLGDPKGSFERALTTPLFSNKR